MTLTELTNKLGFKVKEDDVQKVNSTFSSIKNTAVKMLGAIGIGFSLTSMNALVEEFSRVKNQIQHSTDGLGDQDEIQKKILASATATRTAYSETAKMVSNLVKENKALFGNVDEAIKFNNAATMLFKTAGKTNEDIASLMEAINKSFAKGYIDSETLSQLLERSPEAVELLNRKLGTTSDQLEKMATDGKFTVQDLKDAFVENADEIESAFGNVQSTVTEALTVIRNKWGLWLADTNETLEITPKISRFMVSGFDAVLRALTRVRNGVVWLSEKLGGVNNLYKLIAIAGGAAFGYVALGKLITFISWVKTLDKVLLLARMKIVGIIAVIALIALLIEDFIAFLKGDNSLIGTIFDKVGIGAENVRKAIFKAWQAVKAFLLAVWGVIKGAALEIFGALSAWWAENGEQVLASFSKIWGAIKTLCIALWNALSSAAKAIFGALKIFWDQWGGTITTVFSTIWNTLISLIQPFLDALSALIDFLANVFTGNWQGAWQAIKDFAAAIWQGLVNIINGAWTIITTIWGAIVNFFGGIFQGVWDVVVEKVTGIKNAIVNGFQAAIDWITSLPEQALQWGADIIQGIVDGITGAVGKVVDAVSGVASKIKSFLGFSEPEDGPLSNFHTYMPDMIDLMSKGIADGKAKVKTALNDLTGDMALGMEGGNLDVAAPDMIDLMSKGIAAGKQKIKSALDTVTSDLGIELDAGGFGPMLKSFGDKAKALAGAGSVKPSTAGTVTSSSVNKSVVQNVAINNQFNGDRAIQRKAAKAMDKSANDVTAELARGLAYAR